MWTCEHVKKHSSQSVNHSCADVDDFGMTWLKWKDFLWKKKKTTRGKSRQLPTKRNNPAKRRAAAV